MNDGIIRHRLNLIRDSLVGVSYHLPDEVILYPFLDNNLPLHQAPLVYVFWEGNQCVFSSLKDPDFLSRYSIHWETVPESRIPIRNTPYTLSVHSFPVVKYRDRQKTLSIPVHQQATSLTKALLNETDGSSLPDEFFTSLGISISSQQSRQFAVDGVPQKEPHIEMDYKEVKVFLDPLRLVLDKIFADSFPSKYLSIEKGTLCYPNVFTVVRSCPTASRRYEDVFDYTAGLLLLSKMRSVLEQWCAHSCFCDLNYTRCPLKFSSADECLNGLERPLGHNSRSVSDLIFSSGVVDFGRKAREKEWDVSVTGDPLDEQRRAIEKCVYPSGWRLFYIPIHVGGAPWLALFTFTPQDPASNGEAWHHNYSFYRDLGQKAAALIRQKAHDVYADLLAKHFVKHMESWITPMETIISRINHDAQKLAQVYPFPLARFTKESKSPNDIFVPGRGVLTAEFRPNPFFVRQVSWNLGDDQAILRQCREAIGDFTRIEQSIEINAVAQSSHLLKVPLRVLNSIAFSTTGDKDLALRRHIRRILDLHDVASALISEPKRDLFRAQYRKASTLQELERFLSNQYDASTTYLMEPTVSGNLAPRLRKLLGCGHIRFVTELSHKAEGDVIFYEPLIHAMLDGLLTNAVDSVDPSNPSVLMKVVTGEDRERLFLCVENSTDIDEGRLSVLVRNLNAPGPDMVGITELHWMSKACWPDIIGNERLSWTALADPTRVFARAMIAEFSK